MVYAENADYFCDVMQSVTEYVDIIGGCCGTTPSYIKKLCENLSLEPGRKSTDAVSLNVQTSGGEDTAIFFGGKKDGEKIIAVELDPPRNGDCTALMETANFLKQHNVDVITFAESPSGRTRADSVLMSTKVRQEVGIEVMPHICCRDKNAIGMSSLMLGAYINGIRNMLVITGDPVPSTSRGDIKGVFNFDSVKLMEYISKINEENFPTDKICFGGAINYARKNIEVEVNRAIKKEAAGAKFFLTQPVYSDEDIKKLRYIKSKLKAKVLVGIMPLVSYNNATFIKNEIAGISVPDEVLMQYSKDMTKEEGRAKGIEISAEIMKKTSDFDGYYFTIPFNRLSTAKELLRLVDEIQ
jgi:homocysteine S-methyltransferase